ncbi:ECF transporter S component [Pseudoflavonifractor sp. AF19-9AC]|nr:ECF transporter S component [Pseudoflavonifractor sp. AF19-9AC]
MVSMAMLTAIAYIVMLMSKLMPSVMFLDFDFKDVVICIAGFTFGPLSAAIISILVAFIEMISISTTGIIGFIMNALATCAFCCTASFVYKKMHTKKGAVLGLSLGVVCLVVVMLLWNYLITPMYMVGFSRADVAALLPTLFLPFNLAKGGMNMAATLLLYAPVVTALRKAGVVPPSQNSQGKKMNAGFVLFSFALLATFVVFALVLAGVI